MAALSCANEDFLLTRSEFKRRRRRRRRRREVGIRLNLFAALFLFVQLAAIPIAESRPLSIYSASYSLGRHSNATATSGAQTRITWNTSVSFMNLDKETLSGLTRPNTPIERLKRETTTNEGHYFVSEESQPNANTTAITSRNKTELDRQQQAAAYEKKLAMLKQKFMYNRAISDTAYYIILLAYSLLITFGTVSNSLICLTVILKPQVLSPRNIFIVNLAYSDLLLCVFTMPFSFIEISMKMWHMGLIPCKLVAGLQATSIFVSTISITAIALDRYKVIVYPTHQETSARTAALILGSVWLGALLLSSPLFCFRTVEHLKLPHKYDKIESIDFCVEKWPFAHGRGIYSVISMIFQYVLPITIVCLVYLKISHKLKKRLIRRQRLTQLECQQKRQLNLIKRTHTMLVSVALVFILSWLPLNLLNLIGDFSNVFKDDSGDQQFRLVFSVCHLIGCSSACSNPILYGYLNENFRKELHQVYSDHLAPVGRFFTRLLYNRLFESCRHCFGGKSGIYAQPTPTSSPRSGSGSSSASSSSSGSSESPEEAGNSSTNSSPSSRGSQSRTSHANKQEQDNQEEIISETNFNNNGDNIDDKFGAKRSDRPVVANSMGRTMRFCLCIANGSGSSSTETLGPQQRQQQQKQGQSLRSTRRGKRKSSSIILNGNNSDNNVGFVPESWLSRRSGRNRGFRCRCQCHVASVENNTGTKKTASQSSMMGKSGENNGSICRGQLRRCSTTQRSHGGDNNNGGNRFACPSAGRRVWLRCWPAANNEPATIRAQVQQRQQRRRADNGDGDNDNRLTSRRQKRKRKRKQGQGQGRASGTNQQEQNVSETTKTRPGEIDKQDRTEQRERKKRKKNEKKSRSSNRTNTQLERHCDICREAAVRAQNKRSLKSTSSAAHSLSSSRKKLATGTNAQVVGLELGAHKRQQQQQQQQQELDDEKQEPRKEGRIEGLEMDLMLVGPVRPSQFAGALYLSVESSSPHKRRWARQDADASRNCSVGQEKSTSFLALEPTSSFGFSEQPTAPKQPAGEGAGAGEEGGGEGRGGQQGSSIGVSSADNDNYKNNENSNNKSAERKANRTSSSDSVGPRNDLELELGQVAIDSLPVVVDRGAADGRATFAGAQPEGPISCSPSTILAADDNSNSNSASSSICLTHSHSHSHWQSNSSASCTCSVVSNSGASSSGRSSCAGQPQPSNSSCILAQQLQSGSRSPTVASSICKQQHFESTHQHQLRQEQKRHEVSSCSSSPLEAAELVHTGDDSSCSSSLRSWASLEVARFMAAAAGPSTSGARQTEAATKQKHFDPIRKLSNSEKSLPPAAAANHRQLSNGFHDLQPAEHSDRAAACEPIDSSRRKSTQQNKEKEENSKFVSCEFGASRDKI